MVGELQGEVVERFPGSVWEKGDQRWELRVSRGGGDYGGRPWPWVWASSARFAWAREGGWRGRSGTRAARAKGGGEGRGRRELEKGHTARLGASSPWRFGSRPRRARREMVPRGEVEKLRGGTGGTARGQPVDGTPSPTFAGDERRRHGEKQRGERRDGGEGKTVIRSKFKIHFVNSIFLLLPGLK